MQIVLNDLQIYPRVEAVYLDGVIPAERSDIVMFQTHICHTEDHHDGALSLLRCRDPVPLPGAGGQCSTTCGFSVAPWRCCSAPLDSCARILLTDPRVWIVVHPSIPERRMDHLDVLESRTIYILREAFNRIDKLAMLWSLGKDSNAMLWMAKKAFFGHVPFPCIHIDTGKKFPEMYAFRERYAREWNLDLRTGECPPVEEMDPTLPPAARSAARKTAGLKMMLDREGYDGLIAGIRRDEEGTRAKERVFSPRGQHNTWDFRDQPPEFWDQFKTDFAPGTHLRVHPILHWTEIDIWRYIQREDIPIVDLYYSKNGKRYRSLGDQDITFPVDSTASTLDEIIVELQATKIAERSGRAMDHESEDAFERLRADGYM